MQGLITLVAPDAPANEADVLAASPRAKQARLRVGLLDNSKGNADHLLRFAIEGLGRSVSIESVVSLRKDNAAKGAPAAILDRLATEADFVLTAMAD
jgi:hypothetical protein